LKNKLKKESFSGLNDLGSNLQSSQDKKQQDTEFLED
jgi:hypothetical protein